MIQTRNEALDYLSKNLASLDETFSDFPRETLDILLTERLLDAIAPSLTQEHADHLLSKQEDEWYDEYMREYLGHQIPSFYTDLSEVIRSILSEIQEDWMKEQLELV